MPTVPTLFVVGSAEREVIPDEVEVSLHIVTPLRQSPQEALAHAAEMRARVGADMRARFGEATVADRRIGVTKETKAVEVATDTSRTEYRYETLGFTGHCVLSMRAGADRAAELVAHGGMHPDVQDARPAFFVSAPLARTTEHELECEAVRDGLARARGLAAAAGHAVVGIVSVGEQAAAPTDASESVAMTDYAVDHSRVLSGADVQDALSELRPESQRREARVPVRVAIAPAESAPRSGDERAR